MEAARTATAADVEALAALARKVRDELAAEARGGQLFTVREAPSARDRDGFSDLLDQPGAIVVVGTIDETAVGYAVGRTEEVRDGTVLGVIDDLYVEAGGREVGVGEAMMELLLPWFKSRGCRGVDAMALPGVRATKNFFEMSGFTARLIVMHHRFDRAT